MAIKVLPLKQFFFLNRNRVEGESATLSAMYSLTFVSLPRWKVIGKQKSPCLQN